MREPYINKMDLETNQSSTPALVSMNHDCRVPDITFINSDKFIIGRGNETSLKILDKSISRKHCSLEKKSAIGWIITCHSRNPVDVNDTHLVFEQSRPLKCGDKINFPSHWSFVFKCAPDQKRICCCDRIDLTNDSNCQIDTTSVLSTTISSSGLLESSNIESVQRLGLSTASTASFSNSCVRKVDFTDHSSSMEIDDLREQVLKYANKSNEYDESNKKSIDTLNEYLHYVEELSMFNRKFSEIITDSSKHVLIKKLLSFCMTNYRDIESCSVPESCDLRLKEIFSKVLPSLAEQLRLFMRNVPDLFEYLRLPIDSSSRGNESEKKEQVVESVLKSDIAEKKTEDTDGKLKDELKDYKQNSEWQDARIRYLEMKLKERDKLEEELESAREENDGLGTQLSEMRLKLSKMEVMELELSYLKESTKYKEDDKRSKDELEKQIQSLRTNLGSCKTEIEKISMAKSVLENENMSLKQKCEEIENKLNTKVGCSKNAVTGEYCCDLFSSLKSNLIDALEKEFNCCICNEMFVGATVTNCNHVFCAFCLKEWKKKKKQCPFCRANLTTEYRANVIDECIINVLKFTSDELYAERMQMIEDRKSTAAPPPAKRARRGRGSGVVQHAQMPGPITVRNHTYTGPANPFVHQNFVIDLINLG